MKISELPPPYCEIRTLHYNPLNGSEEEVSALDEKGDFVCLLGRLAADEIIKDNPVADFNFCQEGGNTIAVWTFENVK